MEARQAEKPDKDSDESEIRMFVRETETVEELRELKKYGRELATEAESELSHRLR